MSRQSQLRCHAFSQARSARRTTQSRYSLRATVTVLDCTPPVRHDSYSDSGFLAMRQRALLTAESSRDGSERSSIHPPSTTHSAPSITYAA
jgi:hypothetical protein